MKDQGGAKAKSFVMMLREPFTSWYAWVAVIGVFVGAGGLVYWSREQIASALNFGFEAIATTLGLGMAPAALWLAIFLAVVVFKRSWFRRYNLWIASVFYLAFVLGVLAFFQPYYGPLAPFTLQGDVGLGGWVGDAVAGPVAWLGVLRVLAALVAGTVIASPPLSLFLVIAVGRLLVHLYVFAVVAVKSTVSALGHMYRFKPEPKLGEGQESDGVAGVSAATSRVVEEPPADFARAWQTQAERIDPDTPVSPPQPRVLALAAPQADPGIADSIEGSSANGLEGPTSGPVLDSADQIPSEQQAPAIGKYNRYWAHDSDGPEGQNGRSKALVVQNGQGDSNQAQPVLDGLSASWATPPIDLLMDAPEGGISQEEIEETAETIKRTLAEYSVEVEIGQTKPGPAVTLYGLIPGWVRRYKQVKVTDEQGRPKLDESGRPTVTRAETKTRVKVDTILSREKDLALALKTPSLRIETPVMGESLVGIEVPNPTPDLVTLRGVMESKEFQKLRAGAALPIALGKGSGGEAVVVDLAKAPHLLIAGSTGSGKSVCINTILSGLIMEKTPAEMRLLLVDPKRVELTPYNGIPHLLTPVVVETDQVVALLKGLIREMTQRYRRMEEVGVRNIDSYNARMPEHMPYLVVAVDELADLMMSASFDVEQSLCRLAQLGRATGIHLIVATQRPSVDVVTGLIKANFPSRISFGVTSQIDSRTILDTVGAEKLLGRGDMLYLPVEASRPERVQGVFISDREIERLVDFWGTTPSGPLPTVSLHVVADDETTEEGDDDGEGQESTDEFLDKAIELAHHYNKLSTSLLQRRLRIGYPRAARLMDQLEDAGVVGPGDGSKSRDVIISTM